MQLLYDYWNATILNAITFETKWNLCTISSTWTTNYNKQWKRTWWINYIKEINMKFKNWNFETCKNRFHLSSHKHLKYVALNTRYNTTNVLSYDMHCPIKICGHLIPYFINMKAMKSRTFIISARVDGFVDCYVAKTVSCTITSR